MPLGISRIDQSQTESSPSEEQKSRFLSEHFPFAPFHSTFSDSRHKRKTNVLL